MRHDYNDNREVAYGRYLTATEWRTEGGGFKDKSHLPFKRLPFHCCAITFTPFEDPVSLHAGNFA